MSTSALNAFNSVAPFYDGLARIVFGQSIGQAQTAHFDKIAAGSNVLVIGGGTGRWLPELVEKAPGIEICFVEASSKMLASARRRVSSQSVTFIHGTEDQIPASGYDVVITPFVLDVFDDKALRDFIANISGRLRPGFLWLATDFVDDRWWHRVLLKMMYAFFQAAAGLRNAALPRWREALQFHGMRPAEERLYFGKFISSCAFCG